MSTTHAMARTPGDAEGWLDYAATLHGAGMSVLDGMHATALPTAVAHGRIDHAAAYFAAAEAAARIAAGITTLAAGR